MINYGKRQFIRYVMMGLAFALVTFLLNACETHASTYAKSERVTYYKDSALTEQHNNYSNMAVSQDIGSLNNANQYRNTDFYFSEIDLEDYAGGYITFSFNIIAPTYKTDDTTQVTETNYYCRQWSEGNRLYNCTALDYYNVNNQDTEVSYIQPSISIQAIMTQGNENVSCELTGDLFTCPIKENVSATRIRIMSNVNYGSQFSNGAITYNMWVGRSLNIYADNTKEIIKEMEENEENQQSRHQQTMDTITDDSDQDVSSMSGATGWLPQGTIDGLINLPISLVQGITTGLQGNCTPLTLPLPFVDEDIQLPCIKTIFEQINGVSTLLNLICTPIMAIILYNYLKNLFQWMQSQIAMEGNSNWGGV